MIDAPDQFRVKAALSPDLVGADLNDEFMRQGTLVRMPAGRDLIAAGDRVNAIPVVLSGSIRVYKIGESGREITLYRFSRGECCVLTADSILGNRLFPACAQVEEDAEVVLIPAAAFDAWLARSPAWRRFVFDAMARRWLSLIDTLEDVAFGRMDTRVAALVLRQSAAGTKTIRMTHQQIADELGSSREVVSRILEDFQGRGLIRLSRGVVQVVDPGVLASSALA